MALAVLLQGLPAVSIGIAAYFALPARPADARWLSDAEKVALQQRLELDLQSKLQPSQPLKAASVWKAIGNWEVLALGIAYLSSSPR